jgi:hypothetical protein
MASEDYPAVANAAEPSQNRLSCDGIDEKHQTTTHRRRTMSRAGTAASDSPVRLTKAQEEEFTRRVLEDKENDRKEEAEPLPPIRRRSSLETMHAYQEQRRRP